MPSSLDILGVVVGPDGAQVDLSAPFVGVRGLGMELELELREDNDAKVDVVLRRRLRFWRGVCTSCALGVGPEWNNPSVSSGSGEEPTFVSRWKGE